MAEKRPGKRPREDRRANMRVTLKQIKKDLVREGEVGKSGSGSRLTDRWPLKERMRV
jgi:hypothetical protein